MIGLDNPFNNRIHPTAIIGDNVKLGLGVKIGAYTVIYDNVTIGDGTYIGAGCLIGSPAEDKSNWLTSEYGVAIGDNVIINGAVTIDAGTHRDTTIENSAFLMKGVHIGHDATIRQSAVLSPRVLIGGHSIVGANTNMGMGSIVHQRVEVPSGCMIGMGTVITKKTEMEVNSCYVGNPARYLRDNIR